jgi:hypothetical protein
MWQQLSRRDRTRAVACVFGIAAGAFLAFILVVNGSWVRAALPTFQTVLFAYGLYTVVKRGSGKPQPPTINPGTTAPDQQSQGPSPGLPAGGGPPQRWF